MSVLNHVKSTVTAVKNGRDRIKKGTGEDEKSETFQQQIEEEVYALQTRETTRTADRM